MDDYERLALDMDIAQQDRYRRHPHKIDFWQDNEVRIYTAIKTLRELSSTYATTPREGI